MWTVTRGGLIMYENSPSLQRLLKRLQAECELVLPVDRVNYSLYLDRTSQCGWTLGLWQWTASVPDMPQYGTLGSDQSVTRLLRCKVLAILQCGSLVDPFRIDVLGGQTR
jgi:hypothetical protein